VRFQLNRPLSIQVSYERAVTLPGFKIWYYILSNAIDTVALTIADRFTEAIADASPQAAPIVGFLLRSGIQYGFYELRQEEMHWPFDTEAPLAFDSFKFGFGVAF
jgi:GR25 family glycosyltransferase involved in LPS biosynthesis